MKWGVRRFQNKNGSLTNAGRKRYNNDSESSENNKSKHRQKLEQKYIAKGMSKKQAEMAADRRIKSEKIVAVAAGLTLTAAAVYARNKYVKNRTDQIINSETILQRIEMQDTGGKLHDVFYAAKDKADKTKYAGMLGKTRQLQTGHAYIMQLSAKKDIKVASRENAKKVFKELYDSDESFRKSIIENADYNIQFRNHIKVKGKTLNSKELSKLYDNFNSKLVDRSMDNTANKFYDVLKSKGYNAIQDVNDMKFSGYKAKNPIIIFGAKDNVMVKSMREMEDSEINKALIKVGAKECAKRLSVYGGTYVAVKRAVNTKAINDYRMEHPNTDMTDTQIIKMLSKDQ